ncbi:MAG TPA: DUF6129 family protein [Rhodocyclaceae bacterium]|nr:DUF6129 family protein [Rhodocyclaceae bacterium]
MIATGVLNAVLDGVSPRLTFDEQARHLRASFPNVHITVCGEDDIPMRLSPAAENRFCSLYYVDASSHCLKLTTDPEAASGVVVALRGDD